MLNLESLRVFTVAAETENFSRAARYLHLSQPAVSQHIQALERYLGVQLFERHGRRISLSPVGEALLPQAKELLRGCQQLQETAMALAGSVLGHLTIGCSTTSGKYVLPRLLARYRERYPLVRATVKVGPREQVIEWLLDGDVDVAVASKRVRRSGLSCRRFFQDEVVLVVPQKHPWAARPTVCPEELYQERFILREPTSGTYLALQQGLDEVGVNIARLENVLTLGNSEAIIVAVEEGIGLGFVPRIAAQHALALGRVRVVKIDGLVMTQWLYLADNLQRPHSPALQAFWNFIDTVPLNSFPGRTADPMIPSTAARASRVQQPGSLPSSQLAS